MSCNIYQKNPTIFLDRDGVLTVEKSYVCTVKDMDIFEYAAECIKQIHEKGYYAIVITNQSGVARGLFSENELKKMNAYLIQETGVDGVYYCPHHPEGKVSEFSKYCNCRKPDTGLMQKACLDYNIDMSKSYMIGDRASDILAGQKAGLKTILLETGYGTKRLEQSVTADYIFKDLKEAVKILPQL